MADVRKTRELVDLVLAHATLEGAHDPDTVAMVLMVLDSHNLLRDFPGTPAEYHAKVQVAYSEALRHVAFWGADRDEHGPHE